MGIDIEVGVDVEDWFCVIRVMAYIIILIKRAKLKNRDNKAELLRGSDLLVMEGVDVKGVVIAVIYVIKKTI